MKLKDQLEEINQVLVAENPQLPDNLVEFSFKDKTYVPVVHQDHNITLLDVEGTSLHIDSQEAKDQMEGCGSSEYIFLIECIHKFLYIKRDEFSG